MDRPGGFEAFRFLGDKRTQLVYDLDGVDQVDAEAVGIIAELVGSGHAIVFGPDALAEARNRGYRPRRL